MKDYLKDLKQVIKRLYNAEVMLDRYLQSAGTEKSFFDSLNIEGVNEEFRHPYVDYYDNERECFSWICGVILQLPDDFTHYSAEEVREMIIKQRDKIRRIAGMLDNPRWLGEINYLCYQSRKKRYFTGRLIG